MSRGNGFSRVSALALALVAAPVALVAQSSTTSALAGLVRDGKGQPLAGATVRISSPAMIGGEKMMRTAANGTYRFPMLPPGRYRIVVEAAGQTPLSGSEVLELGRTSSVNWKFQSAASAVVEVVETSNSVEPTPTGLGKSFSLEELDTLPYKRDLASIADLTPGVNGGVAWGGDRRNANAYMMDGMNVGDPGLGTPWIYANPEWFSEVQVGGIGASAEYGGFTGGFINAILKRGGNEMEGAFNTYYSTSNWQAKSGNRDPRFLERIVPSSHSSDVSLSIGGPIIKDKLWYFVSAEQIVDQQTPIDAPVPVKLTNPRFLMKLTWQATKSGTFEAFAEYDRVAREHRGIDNETAVEASRKQIAPNRSFGLTWTQLLGPTAVFTGRVTGFTGRDDYRAYVGETPSVYIDGGFNPSDPTSEVGLIYQHRNAYTVESNDKSRVSFSATLDLFRTGLLVSGDTHAFRMGLEREQSGDKEQSRFPGGISYNGTYETDSNDLRTGNLLTDFVQLGGGYDIRAWMDRTSAFVQDTWTVNSRLTLRPGLRFEQFKGRGHGASTSVWSTTTLAPRFGFTLAATPDQRSLVKGSWGRYFDGLTVAFFDRTIPGAYKVETRHAWGNSDVFSLGNPEAFGYDPVPYTSLNDISVLDPNVKHPYVDEATLSYEQKLGDLWSMTLTAVHRRSKNLLVRYNRALQEDTDPGNALNAYNPITGTIMHLFNALNDDQDYYITNSSEAKRAYQALSVSAERRFANHWSVFTSYTRALRHGNLNRSNGYDDAFVNPNSQINFDGRLPGYNEDEFKARFSYELPWKTRLSGSFTYLSGERWTPTISTYRDNNGNRWSILAEARGAQKLPPRRLLDLRVSQIVLKYKRVSAEVFLDVFNVLNSSAALSWDTRRNALRTDDITDPDRDEIYSDYQKPTSVEPPRNLRLGARITF